MHKRIHKEENLQFTKRKDFILLMVSEPEHHHRKAHGRGCVIQETVERRGPWTR